MIVKYSIRWDIDYKSVCTSRMIILQVVGKIPIDTNILSSYSCFIYPIKLYW